MAEAVVEAMNRFFTWQDYIVFAAMLTVSAAIGVYYGFSCKRKPRNEDGEDAKEAGEFFLGGGKMSTLPVSLSMLASFLSSITLMGQPAEVYMFGPQIWMMGMAAFIAVPIVNCYFVDFFRDLQTASAYEYFGRRFNRKFQLFASSIFSLNTILFLALVLYAPALAFHQVTGISTEMVVVVMYIVCIFYTTVGGIKAVVWTDTFQVIILYGAMVAVLISGTISVGGFGTVWKRNEDNMRGVLIDFDPNPFLRYNFWGTFIGGLFLHLSCFCGNQLQIQRLLSVSSKKEAKKMLWINAAGWALVILLTTYAGMLIFAKYYDCDPLLSKQVKSADQLFPLFVMDVLGPYKGFPGLFVAGIFAAGLSTVSTGVNSLAAIWFAELEGTSFKAFLSKNEGLSVKLLALFFGLLSFGLVFVVPYMGTLVPIAISINGFFSGALFGIFILGIFIPFSNAWGAFMGLISGVAFVGWLTIGGQIEAGQGHVIFQTLPRSTAGCPAPHANFTTTPMLSEEDDVFPLYRISFMWYSLIACAITVTVGVIVSYATKCVSPRIPVRTLLQRTVSNEQGRELVFLSHKVDKEKLPHVYVPAGRELEPKLIQCEKMACIL